MTDVSRGHHLADPFTRRGFFGAVGGVVAGVTLAGTQAGGRADAASSPDADTVPFYGRHQAGITTVPQRNMYFAAFDVQSSERADLVALLRRWTAVAANLCAGQPATAGGGRLSNVEPDSGATVGLGAARLTVNVGFGPSLFGVGGADRFGLRSRWPMALVELPVFPGDALDPANTGGDLTVQACADDSQVAFHAIRQLDRSAGPTASIRWMQAGFNETAASAGTPRDLLGFKDGTVNPRGAGQLDEFVWVDDSQDQPWMVGGTYLVIRRIRLLLDRWDAETLGSQQQVIGREKGSGAPLGARDEQDPPDFEARSADGTPVIPFDAHIRLASPQQNWGQMLLRRSYTYGTGPGVGDGHGGVDAGLVFCAYQQNPRLAFIPIYRRLADQDALRHFAVHTASAIAALPPGAPDPSGWVGEQLFT